jgi:hypothetical protein
MVASCISFKKKLTKYKTHTKKSLFHTNLNDPLEGLVRVRVKRAHKKKLLAKLTKTQSKSPSGMVAISKGMWALCGYYFQFNIYI